MPSTLRSLLTIRHALSLAAILAAIAAGALFFNRAVALPPLIDLGVTPADLIIYGDDAGDQLSFSSASGDINGDTIDDLILGANLAGEGSRPESGKTYVIYGDASFPAVIDLNATSADVTILGEETFDQSGYSVASGDIDGDTIDDVVIGAPFAGGLFTDRGKAYVVYGAPSLPATIDLAASPADLTIIGADSSDRLGTSVAAGNVAGLAGSPDDVIVGAPQGDGPGTGTACGVGEIGDRCEAGETYIVFGSSSLPSTIDLGSTSADVTFYGSGQALMGSALAIGHINDDNLDDFLVGAPEFGTSVVGRVHVIDGRFNFLAEYDLGIVSVGPTITGNRNFMRLGNAVAAGDLNGDTLDDKFITAVSSASTFVVFSPGSSLGAALVISPISGGVVASGDVNGDTTADLLARRLGDPVGVGTGTTWGVFGGASLPATIDLNSAADLTVLGADTGDAPGSVLAADLNGDTFDDLIIGADRGDGPGSGTTCGAGQVGNRCSAGDAYVIFGAPPPTPTLTFTPTPCGAPGPTCTSTPTPTNTLTPTVTPTKLADDGSLSGVFDVLVHDGTKTDQSFYCKARTDHDTTAVDASGGEALKTAATCYLDTPKQAAPGNKVPTDPNIDLAGPPPPPPYGNAGPAKGNGSYCPVSSGGCIDVLGNPMPEDRSVVVTCFPSQGGILGPNVIWVTTVDNVKVDVANQSGTVDVYYGQGILECDTEAPKGPPTASLAINLTRYDQQPYDNNTSVDSDGDGCPDAFELDKRRAKKDCGDDPWNPHDSDLDFTASFSITIEVERADTCQGGEPVGAPPVGCDPPAVDQDIAAGSYYNCQAFLDHDLGDNSVTGKALCYTDNPVTTVNIEDNGGAMVCAPFPSANPEDCGDGLPGSPPPGPFADNDGVTTPGVITGVLDKGSNRLILDVCFSGRANPTEGPNLYMRLDVDAHTGLGSADVWLMRGSCDKPLPGDTPTEDDVPVSIAEQNDANCSFTTSNPTCYDIDQDGCSARQELGTDVFAGGQRDPFNKFDHMDINKDGTINVADDIIGTAALFSPSRKGAQGNVGPRMTGSVPWAHRNGDAGINIPDDILGVAAQFGHNCE